MTPVQRPLGRRRRASATGTGSGGGSPPTPVDSRRRPRGRGSPACRRRSRPASQALASNNKPLRMRSRRRSCLPDSRSRRAWEGQNARRRAATGPRRRERLHRGETGIGPDLGQRHASRRSPPTSPSSTTGRTATATSSSSAARCRRSTTALKVPATKVEGCASQVWIVPRIDGRGRARRASTSRGDFGRADRARADRGAARALCRARTRRRWSRSTRRPSSGGSASTSTCRRSARTGCAPWSARIRAIAAVDAGAGLRAMATARDPARRARLAAGRRRHRHQPLRHGARGRRGAGALERDASRRRSARSTTARSAPAATSS